MGRSQGSATAQHMSLKMPGHITQNTGAAIPYNKDSTKWPFRLILSINVCRLFHTDLPPTAFYRKPSPLGALKEPLAPPPIAVQRRRGALEKVGHGCVKPLGDAEKPALPPFSCPLPRARFAECLKLEGKQTAL